MHTGFILRAGEISEIEKVNIARKNFGYENEDVLVIMRRGVPTGMETITGLENSLGHFLTSLEEGMAEYLNQLNNPTARG